MLFLSDTNRTRLVRKAKPAESFFNFFSPPIPPSEEALENGDIEEDELENIEEQLEIDYQIGEDLKEKVGLMFPLLRSDYHADIVVHRSFPVLLTTSPARLLNTRATTTTTTLRTLMMMRMTTKTVLKM